MRVAFACGAGDGDGRIDAVDLQKFLSTFNANFSLQELEAFINDQACHPNGVGFLLLSVCLSVYLPACLSLSLFLSLSLSLSV
jgi:hypothetical protein